MGPRGSLHDASQKVTGETIPVAGSDGLRGRHVRNSETACASEGWQNLQGVERFFLGALCGRSRFEVVCLEVER